MEEREEREKLIKKEKDKMKINELLREERERYFGHFDEYLNKVKESPRWLVEPGIVEMVTNAIKHQDGKQYDLGAFCILSNHVHMVVTVKQSDASLFRILQKLKSYTAIQANKILKRSGQFWHHESYDHVVRNDDDLERIIWYVLENPIKAGLCKNWEEWKWSYVKKEYIAK